MIQGLLPTTPNRLPNPWLYGLGGLASLEAAFSRGMGAVPCCNPDQLALLQSGQPVYCDNTCSATETINWISGTSPQPGTDTSTLDQILGPISGPPQQSQPPAPGTVIGPPVAGQPCGDLVPCVNTNTPGSRPGLGGGLSTTTIFFAVLAGVLLLSASSGRRRR